MTTIATVHGARIDIDVSEKLDGSIVFANYEETNSVLAVTTEFYNPGSVAYGARMRLDVYKNGTRVSSAWTGEKIMVPGARENFEIFWHATEEGNFTAKLRAYFGNEINESEEKSIEIRNTDALDSFEISSVKTYKDRIEFTVKTNADADAVAVAEKYPVSWIFEQNVLGEMANQTSMKVLMKYSTAAWSPENIIVSVFSKDGSHYSRFSIKLEDKPAPGLFDYILMALVAPLSWIARIAAI